MGNCSRQRRPLLTVAVVVLALTPAACGGEESGGPTTTTTASPDGNSTTIASTSTSTTKVGPVKRVVRWLLSLAPSAPDIPAQVAAYKSLQIQDCSAALSQSGLGGDTDLYKAAANACLAAFHDRNDLWTPADTAYDSLRQRTEDFDCLGTAVFAVLEQVVTAHRQDPDATFEADTRPGGEAPCPRVTSVTPNQNGDSLTVTGSGLKHVRFAEYTFANGNGDIVRIPPPADDSRLTVPLGNTQESGLGCLTVYAVAGDTRWAADGKTFTIVRTGTSSSTSTTTAPNLRCPRS